MTDKKRVHIEIQPIDNLFPTTAHVETAALLSKLRAEHCIEVEPDLG